MAPPASLTVECAKVRAAIQAGRLDDARGQCQRLLARQPNAPEPLFLLGFIQLGTGNPQAAGKAFLQAIAAQPRFPEAYFQLGNLLHGSGQLNEAAAAYTEAIAQQPRFPEASVHLGATLVALGRLEESLPHFRQALAAQPKNADAHNNLGVALRSLGRLDEARAAFLNAVSANPRHPEARCSAGHLLKLGRDFEGAAAHYVQAIQLNPALHEALLGLADCLRELGRHEEAIVAYRKLLASQPKHAEAWNHLGISLQACGKTQEAFDAFSQAIDKRHEFPDALCNLSAALLALNRPAEALNSANRALELDSASPDIRNNLALILLRLGRLAEAESQSRHALTLRQHFPDGWSNLGSILFAQGRYAESLNATRRALAGSPHLPAARFNLAAALLLTGDFKAGWEAFESRATASLRHFKQPRWTGGPIPPEKRLLVHAEQGLGDTLQFARYLHLLAAQGTRVVLEVQPPLLPLLSGFPGLEAVIPKGAPLPPFDLHIPLLSLPFAFGTGAENLPATGHLCVVPEERIQLWTTRLRELPSPRIGLVWSGNAAHTNDHNRSVPLDLLRPLIESTDARFLSLQKEVRQADAALLAEIPGLVHFSSQIDDFLDTAALVRSLDLVITVDTSVAHLAASLGAPTWILLPFAPDWRWGTSGSTTPWYPTARLFRQAAPGDWVSAVAAVAAELRHPRFGPA